jgi:hypothetical protein
MSQLASVIESNKIAICKALLGAGLKVATVEYSGEGDSGSGSSITFGDPNEVDLESSLAIDMQVLSRVYDGVRGEWSESLESKSMNQDDALEMFLDQVISHHGHDGFENGDGGGGGLTVYADSGKYELNHYDNIVEQHHESHSG